MAEKATFKKSDDRRAWYRRLTPLAWVAIIVVLFCCAGCSVVGANWTVPALFPAQETWATETPTPTATPVPDPTAGPRGEPTEWWEEDATATPASTETAVAEASFPAWWADEMTQDEDGQYWPPDEVVEMVREHYEERSAAYRAFVEAEPPDLDGFEEAMPTYFSGDYLANQRAIVDSIRAGERDVGLCTWDMCLITPQEFSEDGLACSVGVACQEGTCVQIDPDTGAVTRTDPMAHSGLSVFRMIYDSGNGHWKIDHLAQYVPPPE
jgi:hypothetical protein